MTSFLPYFFRRSGLWKLAAPPWETGSTTTASGSKNGLRICRCIDMDDRTTYRAHSHAVILDEFSRINADIDPDIMAASMKDQYFGDVNKLQQRFDTQLRKLARRWHVQGSSFSIDYQPVLTELLDEHRYNVQDRAHWTSASLQRTTRSLSPWVVIPADHFPSRAHVICPWLFSTLMLFALCREPAASFRAEVVTMVPARLQHSCAWGLRLHAPLPTARILPKPTKDWLKARPIISFHQGHLSRRPWSAFSSGDSTAALVCEEPTEYIQLVSQDLSGFFTSIPTERFHQALHVLLHRYDQAVALRNTSHWSVYEAKSDHRRRMFKGKWRRQTKVPQTFREEDLQCLLDFVIDNSRSTATCSGRNAALPWDHQLLLLFAILLLLLRTFLAPNHELSQVSNARLWCDLARALC